MTTITIKILKTNGHSAAGQLADAEPRALLDTASSDAKELIMKGINSVALDITIGGQTRFYQAFLTTAPVALDAPSTLTLYEANFADVIGLAVDPIAFDSALGRTPARLVLISQTDQLWQRARYREGGYLLAPTDPRLIGPAALQRWLWFRLTAAMFAGEARI